MSIHALIGRMYSNLILVMVVCAHQILFTDLKTEEKREEKEKKLCVGFHQKNPYDLELLLNILYNIARAQKFRNIFRLSHLLSEKKKAEKIEI